MTYLLTWRPLQTAVKPLIADSVVKGYWLSLLTGLVTIGIIHLMSAGAWLPSVRSTTITSAVPFGKILFPLAVLPLRSGLPMAYLILVKKRALWPVVVPTMVIIVFALSVLYQRGFVISGLMIAALFANRLVGFSYKKAIVIGMVSTIALFILRPLGLILSGSSLEEVFGNLLIMDIVRNFVLGPNFDTADVWPIAIEYRDERDAVCGKTFLAIPARFATPRF